MIDAEDVHRGWRRIVDKNAVTVTKDDEHVHVRIAVDVHDFGIVGFIVRPLRVDRGNEATREYAGIFNQFGAHAFEARTVAPEVAQRGCQDVVRVTVPVDIAHVHGAVLAVAAQHVGIDALLVVRPAECITGAGGHDRIRRRVGINSEIKKAVVVEVFCAEDVGKVVRVAKAQ